MHFALKIAALHWCLVIAMFVWIAKFDRCKCIGLTLLPACLHSSTEHTRHAFCPEECCTALVFGDCTCLCGYSNLIGVNAVAQNCCQPVCTEQHRATRHAFCPEDCCTALVFGDCTSVWVVKLDRCKCSDTTPLPACLHSSTEQQGMHFAPEECCTALVFGDCTSVWVLKLDRYKCSGTTLLPACFHSSTEPQWKHAFCPEDCCTALVFGDCNVCVDSKI